jgi:HAMP domain-containing protein
MNFSLKNRIAFSFISALVIVLIMGSNTFLFLNSLNEQIEDISIKLNNENSLTDEIRISTISMLKLQRKFSAKKASEEDLEKLITLVEELQLQLQKLKQIYINVELKELISNSEGFVKGFLTLLNQTEDLRKNKNSLAINNIKDSTDEIINFFGLIVEKQYSLTQEKEKKMVNLIRKTKTNMLITLIITALGTLLISMVIPGKIALPFRKISDAIRELQECNFDVSIYYDSNDEIGELSRELNKMIMSIKRFEELRSDRISVELRKFDALANMMKKNVLVANNEGRLLYLNNSLYSALSLQSVDVLGREISETLLPESIQDIYNLAIKRKTKIENEPIKFFIKVTAEDAEVESEYSGYANVIPVRGKESSLDYYLMVISKDLFA